MSNFITSLLDRHLEMDRPGVYEMDRQTKCQKNVNATEMDQN